MGPERGGSVERAKSTGTKKTSDSGGSKSTGRSGGVTASVSAKARSLAADGGVDAHKVERLREAIDNGTFKMDFQAIADRIVQEGAA